MLKFKNHRWIQYGNVMLFYECNVLTIMALYAFFSSCGNPKTNKMEEKDGKVTYVYADGALYEGDWKDGKPDGFGRMTYSNGDFYAGEWRCGIEHGNGTFIENDGDSYAGKFLRGKREGHGTLYLKGGGCYYGNFKNDKFDGFGIRYYNESQKYVGYWKQDYKSGIGTLYSDSGIIYGRWEDGAIRKFLLHESGRVYGIDVSKFQQNLRWNELYVSLDSLGGYQYPPSTSFSSPLSFIFVRATQGVTVVDPYFESHFENARNIAFTRGAYHVFSSLSSPYQQARNFINAVQLDKGDLPPVLDIERNVVEAMSPDTLYKNMQIWLDTVEKHYSCRPIIYVGDHVKTKYFPNRLFEKYHFWIARYSGEEKLHTDKWLFWQFTESGRLGKNQPIDINLFNGSYKEFVAYVRKYGVQ